MQMDSNAEQQGMEQTDTPFWRTMALHFQNGWFGEREGEQ